jgi:hypothetical protein
LLNNTFHALAILQGVFKEIKMNVTKQIRGNCQCCGRQQAVVNGLMSKHGYTIKDGWFSGVCSGRNYAPIQVSRTTTDKIIADISAEIPELIAKAEKVKLGEITPKTIKLRFGKEEISFEQGDLRQQLNARTSLEWAYRNRARAGQDFVKTMTEVANNYHNTALVEIVK